MMTSERIPAQWEVWHARFNFAEKKGYKYRPVIVLRANRDGSLVVMVTSATSKVSLEHDHVIQDWLQAGLKKPSIARVDRIAEIPSAYLGSAGKIGKLSERDIKSVTILVRQVLAEREVRPAAPSDCASQA